MRIADLWLLSFLIPTAVGLFPAADASDPTVGPGRSPGLVSPLVLLFADERLYLCPLCGTQFLAARSRMAARYGEDRIWIVITSDGEESSAKTQEAVARRIRIFLRAHGCLSPLLLDSGSVFRKAVGPGLGFILDAATGALEVIPDGNVSFGKERP